VIGDIGTKEESKGMNQSLKIWHWNVNGIRAVLNSGKFQEFVKKARPAILCLNETKIDDLALNKDGVKN